MARPRYLTHPGTVNEDDLRSDGNQLTSSREKLKRRLLYLKCVRIRTLDALQQPLATASGFIRREADSLFLYTAWHVLTEGIDPFNVIVPRTPPRPRSIEIEFQAAEELQPEVTAIGGRGSLRLKLYETGSRGRLQPLWQQDARRSESEYPDLEAVGLHVPFWHDVARLALPADAPVSDVQVIEEDDCVPQAGDLLSVGDTVLVVGYPYGFSVLDDKQPTPVVLTRHIAATQARLRGQREVLLDGGGAPSLSGGPVFLERGGRLRLLGLYTGVLFPDAVLVPTGPQGAHCHRDRRDPGAPPGGAEKLT